MEKSCFFLSSIRDVNESSRADSRIEILGSGSIRVKYPSFFFRLEQKLDKKKNLAQPKLLARAFPIRARPARLEFCLVLDFILFIF